MEHFPFQKFQPEVSDKRFNFNLLITETRPYVSSNSDSKSIEKM